jgi:peptidoglycan pentaglycine glycine transferase (the first glycine)
MGGDPVIASGRRMTELYGGMSVAGADVHANYLLKWEAIRRARDEGFAEYDLWGLAHPGIAHFKAGFGGREVRYVGAWDLVIDPLGRAALEVGRRASIQAQRLLARVRP